MGEKTWGDGPFLEEAFYCSLEPLLPKKRRDPSRRSGYVISFRCQFPSEPVVSPVRIDVLNGRGSRHYERLQILWAIGNMRGVDARAQRKSLLREAMRELGADASMLCRSTQAGVQVIDVVGDTSFAEGNSAPLHRIFDVGTFDVGGVYEIPDASTRHVKGVLSAACTAFASGVDVWLLCMLGESPCVEGFSTEDRSYMILLGTMLSELLARDENENKLAFLAYHDGLTKLPNRSAILARLDDALVSARRRSEKIALLFFDIDDFKEINDSLGHAAGDRALEELADRLRRELRADEIMGRLGGDEFAVVLPRLRLEEDPQYVASRISEAMKTPFEIAGRSFDLSVSIGIALFPDDGSTGEDLLAHADAAMYRAKRNGGAAIAFYSAGIA